MVTNWRYITRTIETLFKTLQTITAVEPNERSERWKQCKQCEKSAVRGTKCNAACRKFGQSSDVFSLLLANPATKRFRNSTIVSWDNREPVYLIIFKNGQTRTEYERVKVGHCHFLAIVHQHHAHGRFCFRNFFFQLVRFCSVEILWKPQRISFDFKLTAFWFNVTCKFATLRT